VKTIDWDCRGVLREHAYARTDGLEIGDEHVSRRQRVTIGRQLVERGGHIPYLMTNRRIDDTKAVISKTAKTHGRIILCDT
jgi:hypothetical protein